MVCALFCFSRFKCTFSELGYWFLFKSFLFKAMSLFIPKILVRRRQGPKWFDSEICQYQKCLRTMRRKLKSHPTLHNMNKVKCIEDILQSKLVQAKTNFETELIEVIHVNLQLSIGDFEKADLFNQYFYSIKLFSYTTN